MHSNPLETYLIKECPPVVYYIPEFITPEEEQFLMYRIQNAPKPKWTQLTNRRLQDYGGIPHKNGIIPEDIPSWLETYMDRISDLSVFRTSSGIQKANHCLVNEYMPGQGIMPHFDGPIFSPTITTITCGSHTVLEFLCENDGVRKRKCSLLLEPRSLVILSEDMYKKYLHTISEVTEDVLEPDCLNLPYCAGKYRPSDVLQRNTRVSLTIRNVPKVLKCNLLNLTRK